MKTKKIVIFAAIPIFINLLFIGLYYSGIKFAQQLIAPTIDWLSENSWREFGLLEQFQNIYLLVILVIFAIAVFKRELVAERLFYFIGFSAFLFLFLEEIDYGLHFYEYFSGETVEIAVRNWHNQEVVGGGQKVKYLKRIVDIVGGVWFVIIPLFLHKTTFIRIKKIVPSRWMTITFIIGILCSSFAHFLQGMNFDVINGISGNLKGNISEFRELNTYYVYMLYAIQLYYIDLSISNDMEE